MTLRHTPTALMWSFIVLFPGVLGTLDVVLGTAAVVSGSLGALTRVVQGVVYLAPLIVLWRTRVVLAPGVCPRPTSAGQLSPSVPTQQAIASLRESTRSLA